MPFCHSCASNAGEKRISPGPTIHTGQFWLVEHAYPAALQGWLVIVLKRHAEALHELTGEEFRELGEIQAWAARLLHQETGCLKEYSVCFAEMTGFYHIHFHIIPRAANWPDDLKGGKSFALLKVSEAEAIPAQQIRTFCERLRQLWGQDVQTKL
jgi:diadenosine tetraphosphate (Ap4A) HIT family hydrolase